jgi:hypothetical protein
LASAFMDTLAIPAITAAPITAPPIAAAPITITVGRQFIDRRRVAPCVGCDALAGPNEATRVQVKLILSQAFLTQKGRPKPLFDFPKIRSQQSSLRAGTAMPE